MEPIKNYSIDIEKHKELAVKHFSQIVEIFKEINIDYWIEYGTMLGAVREKGFIPWDSEFDIGIWNNDYITNKDKLLKKISELGFHVNTSSKDRIKLLHKDLLIGAYTIDIHTYHIRKDIAYVSFNRRKKNIYEIFHSFLRPFDNREIKVYPISGMIKSILKNGNKIPKEFLFSKFEYGNKYSYSIKFDNIIIKEKSQNYSAFKSFYKKIIKNIMFIFPNKLIHVIVNYLKKKNAPEKREHKNIQAIPSHFYLNLASWPFENTYLVGPAEGVKYVENIYGKEWHIGKSNWVNTQNNINKSIDVVK